MRKASTLATASKTANARPRNITESALRIFWNQQRGEKMSDFNDSVVLEFRPYLNAFALKLTRNQTDAEDLVSITVLAAIEIIRKEKRFIENPKGFLGKIMKYKYIDEFCGGRRMRESKVNPEKVINLLTVDASQEQRLRISKISDLLKKYPTAKARGIVLRIQGHSSDDVRKATGLSSSNLGREMFRIRKQAKLV